MSAVVSEQLPPDRESVGCDFAEVIQTSEGNMAGFQGRQPVNVWSLDNRPITPVRLRKMDRLFRIELVKAALPQNWCSVAAWPRWVYQWLLLELLMIVNSQSFDQRAEV